MREIRRPRIKIPPTVIRGFPMNNTGKRSMVVGGIINRMRILYGEIHSYNNYQVEMSAATCT